MPERKNENLYFLFQCKNFNKMKSYFPGRSIPASNTPEKLKLHFITAPYAHKFKMLTEAYEKGYYSFEGFFLKKIVKMQTFK